MQSQLYGLIEAASRTLAPTKPEMEAVLATWHRLGLDQGAQADYLQGLPEAMDLLTRSEDVSDFLAELRRSA
jgi:hypothetical protein